VDAPTSRVSRPLPHALTSFWSPHPLDHSPRSVAPLAEPLAPLSRTARSPIELCHGPPSVQWSSSSSCCVRCSGEFRLLANNTRHPLVCPQPLYFPRFALTRLLTAQLSLRRHRPGSSWCPRCCSSALGPSLEVTNPPMPSISRLLPCCPRNRSLESMCTAVGLLRHGPCPLLPLRWRRAHG
jgi:hypothetical protein